MASLLSMAWIAGASCLGEVTTRERRTGHLGSDHPRTTEKPPKKGRKKEELAELAVGFEPTT